MKEFIYVTEPEAIDVGSVKELFSARYELYSGSTDFTGHIPESCTTLLIRSATNITPSIKNTFPNLKHIIRVGTGVDSIDMDFCNKEAIRVYNAPGANADAVSDYVVGMMLLALRKYHTLTDKDIASWNRFKFVSHSLSSQSIGIIGFGHIGREVHKKLRGFNCRDFFVYDPYVSQASLPEDVESMASVDAVLARSNIVTLHLPLMPQTRHLVNAGNLKLLPKHAILINASRGGIVDEAAAAETARSHDLVYVADTVENEPHVAPDLRQEANIIITPHIASLTEESERSMLTLAVENYLHGVYLGSGK